MFPASIFTSDEIMRTRSAHSSSEDIKESKDEQTLKSKDLKSPKQSTRGPDQDPSRQMLRKVTEDCTAADTPTPGLPTNEAKVDEPLPMAKTEEGQSKDEQSTESESNEENAKDVFLDDRYELINSDDSSEPSKQDRNFEKDSSHQDDKNKKSCSGDYGPLRNNEDSEEETMRSDCKLNGIDDAKRQENPPVAVIPRFPPDPTSFLTGPMQKEFAKSFYNSLSLLSAQTMTNVKNEPGDGNVSERNLSRPLSEQRVENPPRNDSRSSEASVNSNDATDSRGRSLSPCRVGDSPGSAAGNGMLVRPLPGISPKSLAEQLRSSDSASMVVSRQQKYGGRNQGYSRSYPGSGEPASPPSMYGGPTIGDSSPRSSDYPPMPSTSHMTSSPSLHHFTTRYTIEQPADPSRLGVELVLDHINNEPVIEVECGGNRGLLYVNKLCQGSKGQSIHFNEEWLTPNEFQFISGRETAKDWKRSIRHCGKSLKTLMTKGILQVHPPVCECTQCRDLHGSKLFHGKKLPLKNSNNNIGKRIKTSPPFDDASHSDLDDMTRHGFEKGLDSIISHLRKVSGFEANDSPETLDLSAKSHDRLEAVSSPPHSRKRSRDDASDRRTGQEEDRQSTSPLPKRPYSRHGGYANDAMNPNAFAASYALLTPEEQYRRMLTLMSRSLSPGEQQRQFLSLAQKMANPLGMQPTNFGDCSGLTNSLNPGDMYDKSKGKYRSGRDDSDSPFDVTRRLGKKADPAYAQRSPYGSSTQEKYRRSDRSTVTPTRGDQKYIALESRHPDDRSNRSSRDDIRSWTASRHAAMIELNSSGALPNRSPDWALKTPWLSERHQHARGQRNDPKSGSNRNAQPNGFFQDLLALDRAPITKTPVTTLHHRPPSRNLDGDARSHSKHHHPEAGYNSPHRGTNGSAKDTPMLDLQKHAVPMLSLKRPTEENLFRTSNNGKRTANQSDPSMDNLDPHGSTTPSPKRQSSSAPPPLVSTAENTRETRRPTSAQDRLTTSMLQTSQGNRSPPTGFVFHPNSLPSLRNSTRLAPFESYLKDRNTEIQNALDRMKTWTTDDVCNFLKDIDSTIAEHIEDFRKHEIDGEGLPLLTDRHLMDIMNIKLGCALKIVARVKRSLKILPESLSCSYYSFLSPSPTSIQKSVADLKDRSLQKSPLTDIKHERIDDSDSSLVETADATG